jgi:hypothetical protein
LHDIFGPLAIIPGQVQHMTEEGTAEVAVEHPDQRLVSVRDAVHAGEAQFGALAPTHEETYWTLNPLLVE